jgi:hypothetical protein
MPRIGYPAGRVGWRRRQFHAYFVIDEVNLVVFEVTHRVENLESSFVSTSQYNILHAIDEEGGQVKPPPLCEARAIRGARISVSSSPHATGYEWMGSPTLQTLQELILLLPLFLLSSWWLSKKRGSANAPVRGHQAARSERK